MLKEMDDPALVPGVTAFWVATTLATFVMMVLFAGSGGSFVVAGVGGLSFGLLVGAGVYVVAKGRLLAKEWRKISAFAFDPRHDARGRLNHSQATGCPKPRA